MVCGVEQPLAAQVRTCLKGNLAYNDLEFTEDMFWKHLGAAETCDLLDYDLLVTRL